MSGTLFIIAAPSGAGKTSLVRALLEREPDITLSVSYTSRPPRSSEVDGQHYHFVSREVFEHMAKTGAFFEYANVHGDYKGTARAAVEPLLAELERRLRNRASDSSEQIARRIADSRTEIAHASEFDYLVINDDFALAVTDLRAIVQARRLRCDVQQVRHAALMDDLLKPA